MILVEGRVRPLGRCNFCPKGTPAPKPESAVYELQGPNVATRVCPKCLEDAWRQAGGDQCGAS